MYHERIWEPLYIRNFDIAMFHIGNMIFKYLKQTDSVGDYFQEFNWTQQAPRLPTQIVYQLHTSNFLTLINPSQHRLREAIEIS
jgi:hypothetical protein